MTPADEMIYDFYVLEHCKNLKNIPDPYELGKYHAKSEIPFNCPYYYNDIGRDQYKNGYTAYKR